MMLSRWLIYISFAAAACSAPAEGMSSVSTTVIDRPAETISTRGVDCQRGAGTEQTLVPKDLLDSFRDDAQRMTDELLTTVRSELRLLEALTVTYADCQEQNAFYHTEAKKIELCNELFSNVAALWFGRERAESDNRQRILGAWRFVFFHELGHALVDLYDLPVEDEEDAVDNFSTLKLIESGLTEDALSAAGFWHNKSKTSAPCTGFFDAHSLSHKRFQAIVCLVYGSAPEELDPQVAQYELPEERLCVCPLELAKQSARWEQLLDQAEQSPFCGYLETPCCQSGSPCGADLACVSARCVPSECG